MLKMNHATWSPLFLSLEEALVSRSGFFTFFHDYMRQAVEARYLNTKDKKDGYRRIIGAYFAGLEAEGGKNDRFFEEVPFQLEQMQAYEPLMELITSIDSFTTLSKDEFKFDLYRYWRAIPERMNAEEKLFSRVTVALEKVKSLEEGFKIVDMVAGFLKEIGAYERAEILYLFVFFAKHQFFSIFLTVRSS
jgi:hypothetical protein